MKKRGLVLSALLVSLLFARCDLLNQIEEKLNILAVKFDYNSTGIGLVTPSLLDMALNPKLATDLSQFGISINCKIDAKNDNDKRAAFDGADFFLRVKDIDKSATPATTKISPFTVSANSDTTITIPFQLTLDNPVFSESTLSDIIQGKKIPYNLSADLFFSLVTPNLEGGLDTLGSEPLALDVVTDSISTRPSNKQIQLALTALGL